MLPPQSRAGAARRLSPHPCQPGPKLTRALIRLTIRDGKADPVSLGTEARHAIQNGSPNDL
jgi:hypothetical protein